MDKIERKERSGASHDCPFCGYHIVVCNSPEYLKCIYCCRRWKLLDDENNEEPSKDWKNA